MRNRSRPKSISAAVPSICTKKWRASPHVQIQFGGRVERASFEPKEDEPARDFNNFSGSVGLLFLPTDQTTIAFSLARSSRNPALEELYFHGPHPGNAAIENGNPDLESEHGAGLRRVGPLARHRRRPAK